MTAITTKEQTIGERLSPVLAGIEDQLWAHEADVGTPPCFTDKGFRAAMKIFMASLLERLYARQEKDNLDIKTRGQEAHFYGQEFRTLVKRATGIDTHSLYKGEK